MIIHELKTNKFNTSLLSIYRNLEFANNSYDFSSVYNYLDSVITPTLNRIVNYFRFDTAYFFPISIPIMNFSIIDSSDLDIRPIPRRLIKSFEKLDLKQINVGFTNLSRDVQFMSSSYLTAVTSLYNSIRTSSNTDSVYSSFMDFISKSGVYINNLVISSGITETVLEDVEEQAREDSSETIEEIIEEEIIDVPPPTVTTVPPTNTGVGAAGVEAAKRAGERSREERVARAKAEYEAKKAANDAAKGKAAADLKAAQEKQTEAAARVEEAKQAAQNANEVREIMGGKEGTASYRNPDGTLVEVHRTSYDDGGTHVETLIVTTTYPDGTYTTFSSGTHTTHTPVVGDRETTYISITERDAEGKTTSTLSGTAGYGNTGVADTIGKATSSFTNSEGEKVTGAAGREATVQAINAVSEEADALTSGAADAYNQAYEQYEDASSDVEEAQQTLDEVQAETPSAPTESDVSEADIAQWSAEADASFGTWDSTGYSQEEIDSRHETYNEAYVEARENGASEEEAVQAGNEAVANSQGDNNEESNP